MFVYKSQNFIQKFLEFFDLLIKVQSDNFRQTEMYPSTFKTCNMISKNSIFKNKQKENVNKLLKQTKSDKKAVNKLSSSYISMLLNLFNWFIYKIDYLVKLKRFYGLNNWNF